MNFLEFSLSGIENLLVVNQGKALVNVNGETLDCLVREVKTGSGSRRFEVVVDGVKSFDFYLWHIEPSRFTRLPGYACFDIQGASKSYGYATLMLPGVQPLPMRVAFDEDTIEEDTIEEDDDDSTYSV